MERNTRREQSNPLRPHQFITDITRKTGSSPKVNIIRGYVGESEKRTHTRIYLDIELKRFVDVPTDGIVHVADLRANNNLLAPVFLWVNTDAGIIHHGNWFANEDPTTMATGEEGGGDPTTMATGEEDSSLPNPLDWVSNPFGKYS